jgi:hypothetical protein
LVLDGEGPARVPDDTIAQLKARERDGVMGQAPHDRIMVLMQILGAWRPIEFAVGDVIRAGLTPLTSASDI